MQFVKLTFEYNRKPTYVNPNHIVSVWEYNKDNMKGTAVNLIGGEDNYIVVSESIESVIDLIENAINVESKYLELLFAVQNKFADESRHETALRYIQRAESRDSNGPQVQEIVL